MLKRKALFAAYWSSAEVILRQGLQFGLSVVLARLLTPHEFGTIALLYLLAGIAGAIVDSGLSAALIQRRDVTKVDESSVFWFNLTVGAVIALGLMAAAPVIASFFDQAILVPLTAVLALTLLVGAIGSIHSALLTKQLEFRTQLKVSTFATALSGLVAIVLAWRGFGVWALAAQSLVATTTTTVSLWLFHRWRPDRVFSVVSVRKLFGFGGYMLIATLLDVAYRRLYTLLVGKLYGVGDLGLFGRAESVKQVPADLVGGLARVALPAFVEAVHDKDQLHRGVRLALRSTMLINVPMMLGLAALAEPLVLTVFGPAWLPSAPILEILCLGGLLWPAQVINVNILMAQGHSHPLLRLEVVKKTLGMMLLAIGALHGVTGIAWSQVAFSLLAFFMNSSYTKRYLGYGPIAQIRDFLPTILVSAPMAAIVSLANGLLWLAPALKLSCLVLLGASIFVGFSWVFRLVALQDAVALLRNRRSEGSKLILSA